MEYTINQLAQMAGISTRTLRWYDTCGLLKPNRIQANGYRVYGQAEVDRLQQILFYRESGVPLAEIGRILSAAGFAALEALEAHHAALCAKRSQLDTLITNAEKSMQAMKGESTMSDQEKFEGFQQKRIDDNEAQYGAEIRAQYGDDAIDRSNAKFQRMSEGRYAEVEALSQEVNDALKAAFEQGDPAGEPAQKACELHKRWLSAYWDSYSKEAHLGLGEMYAADPRFSGYYDKIAPGCAVFLRDALRVYCR